MLHFVYLQKDMNIWTKTNDGSLQQLTNLCGNFITSLWNGLTIYTKVQPSLITDMDGGGQGDQPLQDVITGTELAIADLKIERGGEIATPSTMQNIGRL